jgi:dienelactone hydrolase
MRLAGLALGALVLAGCAGGMQTLRPAAGSQPAIRAAIQPPDGAGPFPVVILLHGCAGLRQNTGSWSAALRERGFLVAIPDQFGPRGITEVCSQGDYMNTLFRRIDDSVALVRLLQARPDVRPDRVVVVGFSMGGQLAAELVGESVDHLWTAGGEARPRPAAGVAVYPPCTNVPLGFAAPLLIIAGGADDWTPAATCARRVEDRAHLPRPPRLLVIPGAHHSFDEPEARGLVTLRQVRNGNSPTGFGATIGYDAAATREAQRAALAFLDRHMAGGTR